MSAREPREIKLAEIRQTFELASYWFGATWCPAVTSKATGYSIRVIKSATFSGSNRSFTYDYFYLDADGVITTAPRGFAKEFKPGQIADIGTWVERFATPDPTARRIA